MSENRPEHGRRAVFRVPGTSLLGVLILVFCVSPAIVVPELVVLYLVPIGLTVWIVRTRTTASREGLTARTMFRTRELPWSALRGLSMTSRSKVRAVLHDGSTIPLPAVRTRHLPVLSLVSEGRIADPSGVLAENEGEEDETEEPEPARPSEES